MIITTLIFEPTVVVKNLVICASPPGPDLYRFFLQGEDEGLNRIYGCDGRTNPWKSNGTGWQRPPVPRMEKVAQRRFHRVLGMEAGAGHALSLHSQVVIKNEHVCVCTYIYIHICIYVYVYLYMYTCNDIDNDHQNHQTHTQTITNI